jgi:microcystin-dependent protein
MFYPIGSIYWTGKAPDDGGDPNVLFGGTWVQIKDKFIWAKGDTDTLNATGGAKTVTLSTAEMPSHSHGGITGVDSPDHAHAISHGHSGYFIRYTSSGGETTPSWGSGGGGTYAAGSLGVYDFNGYSSGATARHQHGITAEGGGGAHENMPPYIVKYCWERTA